MARRVLDKTFWEMNNLTLEPEQLRDTKDVVVGICDTGIDSTHEIFSPENFPNEAPEGWKGWSSNDGKHTTYTTQCSNKILLARAYSRGTRKYPKSARYDTTKRREITDQPLGHGTKVSAVAAGNLVRTEYLNASQPVSGVLPDARISVYKCTGMYAVACALKDACSDGCNAVNCSCSHIDEDTSLQLDCDDPNSFPAEVPNDNPLFQKIFLDAAFDALPMNVLVCTPASNCSIDHRDGVCVGCIKNDAPWVITVGGSDSKTKFLTPLTLSTSKIIMGGNLNTVGTGGSYPLILETHAFGRVRNKEGKNELVLNPEAVKNKIVVCLDIDDGWEAADAGAVGIVFALVDQKEASHSCGPFPLPTAVVCGEDAKLVIKHTRSGGEAQIDESIEVDNPNFPSVVNFSAKGPSKWSDCFFLKPDVCCPAAHILTAVPGGGYTRASGTSFACPVVTAIAAYIHKNNPRWSLFAVKSAIMTTATDMNELTPYDVLGIGSGLINPKKALNPGLIFDMKFDDLEAYKAKKKHAMDLNLPSFSADMPSDGDVYTFTRTLTNVEEGEGECNYEVQIKTTDSLEISVTPQKLNFDDGLPKNFQVSVKLNTWEGIPVRVLSATLRWVGGYDGQRVVKMPIVVYDKSSLPLSGSEDLAGLES